MLYPLNSSVAPCKRATAKAKLLILEAICHEVGGGVDLLLAEDKNRGKNYNNLSSRTRGRNEVTEVSPLSFASRFVFKSPTFP